MMFYQKALIGYVVAGAVVIASACSIVKPSDNETTLNQARVVGAQTGNVACLVVWTQMAGDRVALQHGVAELRSILASENPSVEAVNRIPGYFHDPDAQLYIRAALGAVLATFAPGAVSLDKASPAFAGLEALAESCNHVIASDPHQHV